MGVVMFYHLTRSAAADTLLALVNRAVAQGWRVMIRGTDAVTLDRLDAQFWQEPEDGFLPHGLEGGPQDADQPLLLGQGAAVNGAQALALIDGAAPLTGEVQAMERVWVLFDGADPERLQAARLQWKALSAQGVAAQYWSEEAGRWEKKTETNPGS